MSIREDRFHLTILLLLSFLLILSRSMAHADEVNERANESLDYLKENVIWTDYKDIDITKAELSINTLNQILKEHDDIDSMEFSIRWVLARSLATINHKRQKDDVAIDISQVEQAKADFDYVISRAKSPSTLMYRAGHNAFHLLKSNTLAFEYWEKCGYLKHAGCMNIMADSTFTGNYGGSINLSDSISWHQKVAETQTDFNCAGLYSINMLMQISAYFKELNTGGTWQSWQTKRDELITRLREENEPNESAPCNSGFYPLVDYILLKSEGIENTTLLDEAISSATNEQYIDTLLVMKNGTEAALALEFLPLIEDGSECHASLYLALYAKYSKQAQSFSLINDYMTELHYCTWEQGIKSHMETAGVW